MDFNPKPLKTMFCFVQLRKLQLALLVLALLSSVFSFGQTTLFSENFEVTSEGELSTTAFNGWKQYTVTSTASDWAITNNCPISGSYSLTLHAYGAYCEYAWDDTGNEVAYYGTLIDATAYNTTTLSFDWNCGGETSYDYGRVCYSTNGTTWTDFTNSGTYVNAGTTSVTNLDISEVDGGTFYLGFRWINDSNTGTDPGMNVDNIVVQATSNCAVTAGTVTATPNPVAACSNSTATLSGYGAAPATIMWQYSLDNVTWFNSGVTTPTFTGAISQTTYVRAQVTNGCTSTSNTVTITTTNDGTNYYVNDNSLTNDAYCTAVGNAANNGQTPCTPKTTLQDVFDTYDIDPGDTIFVDAGTYTMGLNVTSTTDQGSAANDVVIIGAGNTLTNITAPAADDNFYFNNVHYFLVKDMHLISTQPSNYNYYLHECNDHLLDGCHLEHTTNVNVYLLDTDGANDVDDNAVANCTIDNSAASGYNIWIRGDADNDTIRGCTINSTGTTSAKAVVLNDYNIGLSDGWPTAIQMFDNVVSADDYGVYGDVVDGNTMELYHIYNNQFSITSSDKSDGAAIWLDDHGLSSSDVSTIHNNIISGGKNGIYLTNGVDYVHFYNNFICDSEYGVYVNDNASDDNDLQHNSFYSSKECVHFNSDSKAYWNVRNNIFYSTSNSSFACVNAGNTTSTMIRCDYNLYYTPNGAYVAKEGASYYTLAGWQGTDHHDGAGNGDNNSVETDPNYQGAATCKLELVGNYQTGTSIGITTDIYGTARTNPTIGAWEENSTLSVELSHSKGECDNGTVRITWGTQTEINNDYFRIERSLNGFDFDDIAEVLGAGTSQTENNYSFIDENSAEEIAYYRIVQIDYDGKETVVSTMLIECNEINNLEISELYPNPTNSNLNLTIVSPKRDEVLLTIYSASGKLVYQKEFEINDGYNPIKLSVEDYAEGVYLIKVVNTHGVQRIKHFVKN